MYIRHNGGKTLEEFEGQNVKLNVEVEISMKTYIPNNFILRNRKMK